MRFKVTFVVMLLVTGLLLSSIPISSSTQKDETDPYSDHKSSEEYHPPKYWTRNYGITFNNSDSKNYSAVMDNQGNMHMTWGNKQNNSRDISYLKLGHKDGEKLINDYKVSKSSNRSLNPKITVDDSDHVFIIWEENSSSGWNIYLSKLEYDSKNISLIRDKVLIASVNKKEPVDYNIQKGEDDIVHIVWEGSKSDKQNIFYKSFSTTDLNFSKRNQLTYTSGNSSDPNIRIAKNGNIHLIWVDNENKNKGLYYQKYDKKMNMLVPRRRFTIIKSYTQFDFTLDSSHGNIHLVFDDNRYHDRKRDIFYTKLNEFGETMIDDRLVTIRGDDKDSFSPSIAIDDMNDIYVTWSDSRDYTSNSKDRSNLTDTPHDIYIKKTDMNFTDESDPVRLTGNISYSSDPMIITDDKNDLHLFWKDDVKGFDNIFYKMKDKVDFRVKNKSCYPEAPIIGQNHTVSFSLSNLGRFDASTTAKFYHGKNTTGTPLNVVNISIPGDGEISIKANRTVIRRGWNWITVILNEDKEIEEKSYSNNIATLEYFVKDLSVDVSSDKIKDHVMSGDIGDFTYQIQNTGNIPQNISTNISADDNLSLSNSSRSEKFLKPDENISLNFSVETSKDIRAGEYNINITVRSTKSNDFKDNIVFSLIVDPEYDLDLSCEVENIKSIEEMNYTTTVIITNKANTKQHISTFVQNGSNYAYIERGEMILDVDESKRLELNMSGYEHIDGETLSISVLANSLDSNNSEELNLTIVGEEEKEEESSWFDSIPWFWIIVIAVLAIGAFIGFIILKRILFS